MAKKFLNGWQAPKFEIAETRGTYVVTLDLRYQALMEYVEEVYIEHELLNGTTAEKFLYANYYWELNYSAIAEASELMKIRKVLNSLQRGDSVVLFPHKDITRHFYITSVKDRLTLGRHYGGGISPGEKDFSITFKTKIPVTAAGAGINWIELDDDNRPTRDVFNQHYYLADEAGDLVLNEDGMPVIISLDAPIEPLGE